VDTMHMVVDMEMLMVKADIINIYFFHYGIWYSIRRKNIV
jgi:hypothetical protein